MNLKKSNSKLKLVYIFTFLLLMIVTQTGAQNQITLKGRILDSETKQPLPFATVSIPKSMTGVISNEFGEFQYHIPEKFEKGEVQITFIGYDPIKIDVSKIKSDVLTTFKMQPKIQQLKEVEITSLKGKTPASDIVFKAVRYITKTHPNKETLLYGYYRDYVRPIQSNDYKNLLEAALVIDDKGFNTFDSKTKIKLEQLRYKPDVAIDSTLNSAYDGKNKFVPNARLSGANELSILRAHDPIRNHDIPTFSYVYIFDNGFYTNHNFLYEDITRVNSDTIYCIHFDTHIKYDKTQTDYKVDGQIYIISKTYAILKFNYTVTCNSPTYSGKFFDLKLEYKNYNDKYYLNYLSMMNYFVIKNDTASNKDTATATPFFQYRELFINKIVNKPFDAFKPHETINKAAPLLTNKIPVKEGFWDHYNYTDVSKLQE